MKKNYWTETSFFRLFVLGGIVNSTGRPWPVSSRPVPTCQPWISFSLFFFSTEKQEEVVSFLFLYSSKTKKGKILPEKGIREKRNCLRYISHYDYYNRHHYSFYYVLFLLLLSKAIIQMAFMHDFTNCHVFHSTHHVYN